MGELRDMLPLLERPRDESGLDDEAAGRLVAYGATAWSDWWASKALDWVDEGVWSEAVGEAPRRTAQDETYSQVTRHRAWRHIKHRVRSVEGPREFVGFLWQDDFADQTGVLVEATDVTEAAAIVRAAYGDAVRVSLWNQDDAEKPR